MGPGKVWGALKREGIVVPRCRVERLMAPMGLAGRVRGRKCRTAKADATAARLFTTGCVTHFSRGDV